MDPDYHQQQPYVHYLGGGCPHCMASSPHAASYYVPPPPPPTMRPVELQAPSIDLHRRIAVLETELKHAHAAAKDGQTANQFLLNYFAKANLLGVPNFTTHQQADATVRFKKEKHDESDLYRRIATLEKELAHARSGDTGKPVVGWDDIGGFGSSRETANRGQSENCSAADRIHGRHGVPPTGRNNVEDAVLERIRELEQTVTRLSFGSQKGRGPQMGSTSGIQKSPRFKEGEPRSQGATRELSPPPHFINHFQHPTGVDQTKEEESLDDKESVLSDTLSLGNSRRKPRGSRPVLLEDSSASGLSPGSLEPSREHRVQKEVGFDTAVTPTGVPSTPKRCQHFESEDEQDDSYGPLYDTEDEYVEERGGLGRSQQPVQPTPSGKGFARETKERTNCLVGSEYLPSDFFDNSTARYTPPKRMNDVFRTILIANIPSTTTLADITHHVRGGMLISAELFNTSTITRGGHTARVVFFREVDAQRYIEFRSKYPLYFQGVQAHLNRLLTPTYPLPQRTMTNVLERGATRCLVIHNFPPHLSVSHIYTELSRGDFKNVHGIESIREDHTSANNFKLYVTFVSLDKAGLAYARINNFRVFVPAKAWYVGDPCAGAVEELYDIEGHAPAPESKKAERWPGNHILPTAPKADLRQRRPYSPPDFSTSFLRKDYPPPVTPRRPLAPAYQDRDTPNNKRVAKVSGDDLDYGDVSAGGKPSLRMNDLRRPEPGTSRVVQDDSAPVGKMSGTTTDLSNQKEAANVETKTIAQRRAAPIDYSDLYAPEDNPKPSEAGEQSKLGATPGLSGTDSSEEGFVTIKGPCYVNSVKQQAPDSTVIESSREKAEALSKEEDNVLAEIKGANAQNIPPHLSFATTISFDDNGNVIEHSKPDTDSDNTKSTENSLDTSSAQTPAPTTPALAFQQSLERFKRSLSARKKGDTGMSQESCPKADDAAPRTSSKMDTTEIRVGDKTTKARPKLQTCAFPATSTSAERPSPTPNVLPSVRASKDYIDFSNSTSVSVPSFDFQFNPKTTASTSKPSLSKESGGEEEEKEKVRLRYGYREHQAKESDTDTEEEREKAEVQEITKATAERHKEGKGDGKTTGDGRNERNKEGEEDRDRPLEDGPGYENGGLVLDY